MNSVMEIFSLQLKRHIHPATPLSVYPTNLFSQLTRLVWTVKDFIIKDRKVECQAQPDGVSGLHFRFGDLKRILVGLLRVVDDGYKKLIFSNSHIRHWRMIIHTNGK